MQQPRQMYQEGGIMPRLNQLGSGVSSAEQMLQGINQRLESAESSLGEGGGQLTQLPAGGTLANMSNANFNTSNVNLNPGLTPSVQTPDPFFGKKPLGADNPLGGLRSQIGNGFYEMNAGLGQPLGQPLESPIASAMRGMAADGGMMGRQNYGLGSLVKSVKKGVKGVVSGVKDFAKSDIGKAALLGTAIFGLPTAAGQNLFSGFKGLAPLKTGITGLIGTGIDKLTPGADGPSFKQFASMFGLGALGGAALQALEASGAEEKDITDIDALRSYLRQGYQQLNPEASNDEIDAFVEQNTVEYRANGGRIGYAEGMNDPKTLPKGLTMDTTTKNPIPKDALPKEIEYISKVMLGPGRSGIGEPEDGTMKGYQFFRDQFLPKKVKELSENFGYSEDEIYKMINTRVREYLGNPGKPLMAEGGRMKYAMGDSAEQNAMQASGIMGLPLNKNPAGITELDLRETGGFIPPVGVKEKADDIPAMLSNNEFVFTADAVRGMGGGDVEKGAQKLYDQMKMLEEGGRVA
jgi:hypothetical protein